MEQWGTQVLENAASATVLAGIVALVARRLTRPSFVHVLWLLVLVKLVSLPALELRFPSIAGRAAEPVRTAIVAAPDLAGFEGPPIVANPHRPADVRRGLTLVVGLGAATVLLLAAGRVVRFRRLLRRRATTPAGLQERTARLAVALGLARPPRIRVVPERIPPSVWPGLGRPEILLPAALVDRLSENELEALLAHELAHVRRRDHWVRPLELAITALYWWHPVAWWARRNLRVAEEKSCDALVLRTLPGRARDYAEGLLKTVEFLSVHPRPVPALAVGAGETSRLKERVVMILDRKSPARVSRSARVALSVVALTVLLVSPAWVESKAVSEGPAEQIPGPVDRELMKEMIAMHREELRLEKELAELHAKRRALHHEFEAMQVRLEQEHLEKEVARLAADGLEKEAAELRRQVEEARQELARRLDESRFDQLHAGKEAELSLQLRELELAREEMMIEGRQELAEELVAKSAAVEAELRKLHLEGLKAEVRRNAAELERDAARLEAEKEHAVDAGKDEE